MHWTALCGTILCPCSSLSLLVLIAHNSWPKPLATLLVFVICPWWPKPLDANVHCRYWSLSPVLWMLPTLTSRCHLWLSLLVTVSVGQGLLIPVATGLVTTWHSLVALRYLKDNFEMYIAIGKLLPVYRQNFFCYAVLNPLHAVTRFAFHRD